MATAQQTLHYLITGNAKGLVSASEEGSRGLSKMEREARRLEAAQRKLHGAMTTVGRGMVLAGAAIATGLAMSVRAAIEWESAWAGVLKTVDGTPEQMAALEEEIRGLAGVLPATHTEIAAVAEAAGQLGVQRQNVAAFTRTMIDMGEATNLTSDAAATALARLMNIMQTAPENVDRLASAVVDLGNKGATTEAEITEMALRIAGAGATIGLNEQQVLGFAAALSNVGIAAEAGGSSISRVFLEIDRSVKSGGDSLQVFADTAGMSVDEFVAAYRSDAGGAIAEFIAGLGRVQERGGDVNAILSQLGLTEIRVSDALRRLAGSGNNLADSLRTGADAWDENIALTQEAERRYDTTAARMAIARNQVNDFAISIGSSLLPAVGAVADDLSTLISAVGDLPAPVRGAIGVLAALVAALLLLGGTALLVVPRIAATKKALAELGVTAASTAAGLRATSSAMVTAATRGGPWIAAILAAGAALGLFADKQKEFAGSAEEFASTLDEQTGKVTHNTRVMAANNLEKDGALEAARKLGISSDLVVEAVLGEAGAMAELMRQFRATDAEFDTLGLSQEEFLRAQDTLGRSVSTNRDKLEESQASWRREAEAIGGVTDQMSGLDPAAQAMADSLAMNADEASTLTNEVDALDKALQGLFNAMFGVEEAQDAAAQAMRRLVDEAADGATAWKGNGEEALRNRDNIRQVIDSHFDVIAAMAEAGATSDELVERTEKLRRKFVDQMRQAGFSEEAIEHYAAAYDAIPSEVETRISTPGLTQAEKDARNLRIAIDRIPRNVNVLFNVSQAGSLPGIPGARGGNVGFAAGGEVPGSLTEPPDRRLARVTPGEIVIRRPVAQANRAALLALNATGRLPTGGGVSVAVPNVRVFIGDRELTDIVRVEVDQQQAAHDGELMRNLGQGVGALA